MAWNTWNNGNGGNRPQKPKYTKSEKMAFDSGLGFGVAVAGRTIVFDSKKSAESFAAGVKRGMAIVNNNPQKYPTNPKVTVTRIRKK